MEANQNAAATRTSRLSDTRRTDLAPADRGREGASHATWIAGEAVSTREAVIYSWTGIPASHKPGRSAVNDGDSYAKCPRAGAKNHDNVLPDTPEHPQDAISRRLSPRAARG